MNAADRADVERPARLLLVLYAVWAVVVGIWGGTAPVFTPEARSALAVVTAVLCLTAAVWRTQTLYRWAFGAVFGYSIWSAARVILSDTYTSALTIVGATMYAVIGCSALGFAGMLAVLDGVMQAADHEDDGRER